MPFTLPDLPYAHDALEPTIDARTMEIHHSKHHQAYVDNANKALAGTEWENSSVESVLASLAAMPDDIRTAVRNNAGGHANHSLFWELMSPDGGGEPEGELKAAIDDLWGSTDELKNVINDNGVKRFGSGWTWLIYDGTGLAVKSTPNQDSPVIDSDVPLLGIDVWEHAYYLNYQNRRPDYLAAWWNVVNWVGGRAALRIGRQAARVGAVAHAPHRRHRQARRRGRRAAARRGLAGARGRKPRRRRLARRRGACARRAGGGRARRPRRRDQRRRGRLRGEAVRAGLRGRRRRGARRDRQGELLRHAGGGAAPPRVAWARGHDRGRRRLPALARRSRRTARPRRRRRC